jgi:hypothetical protein
MNATYPLIHLFDKKFNIPNYQRGYRWEEQEVTELLDDLWEFEQNAEKGEFYCLQPVVLRKISDHEFDVIDGQQRLTTLYLILVYLEKSRFENHYDQELYTLSYLTRKNCESFLAGKQFERGIDESNIDYFHICNAYRVIDTWFKSHAGAMSKMPPILMDPSVNKNRNVRLIWYEIAPAANPIEAFIRLNVGKIPLTDAELIKALLMQADKYSAESKVLNEKKLFEIASEWDQIEYALQKEQLWYFLNNKANESPTHIEFIFDLIASKKQTEFSFFKTRPIKHATYLIIGAYLERLRKHDFAELDSDDSRMKAVQKFWGEVTTYYGHFAEWYEDRDLYHYIGYLIEKNTASEIDHLIAESKKRTKSKFKTYLEERIAKTIKLKYRKDTNNQLVLVPFEELCYESTDGDDKAEIQTLLFLHNVIATLNSDKELARFPFDHYKKVKLDKNWSLEHIHPRNIQDISAKNQKRWLEDHIISLKNLDALKYAPEIQKMTTLKNREEIEPDAFNQLFERIYKIYQVHTDLTENAIHQIGNLCLVDAELNSHLNNSVFDVKREKIKQQEVKGKYIPICSRNAFLKAYTEFPKTNSFWVDADKKAYINNMVGTLNTFLPKEWKN